MVLPLNLTELELLGRRRPLFARHGAVATSQPIAAAAGLEMLQSGGSAVDAAIATAACLTVVEPTSNGLGSDAFSLVWDSGTLHGLNASGRAAASLSAQTLRDKGMDAMPRHGWESITVPGAVQSWADLHARFGRLPFARLMEPAIRAAADGFVVSPVVQLMWRKAADEVQPGLQGELFAEWARIFSADGHAPQVGEVWRNPDQAATLTSIAETSGESFYRGELAERFVAFAQATGGYLTLDDLASHRSTWVDPISASYRGFDVWQIPPNGQGIAVLLALGILDGYDVPADTRDPAWQHLQIEAMKRGLTDAHAYVADPEMADVPVSELLSSGYTARRRAEITDRASIAQPGDPASHTVFLVTADDSGQMVSFIQSNYTQFGSHIVVPGTGISLQNRGFGFSLVPGHPNELAGGKRPFHTLIPGFLTKDDAPVGPFGVMGAHMQAQGHVQLISHTIDGQLDPQTALDRPRWHWSSGLDVQLEPTVPQSSLDALSSRGHQMSYLDVMPTFGRGQAIWRHGEGLIVGSDSRSDSYPMGY